MTQLKGSSMQFDDWRRIENPWRLVEAAKTDEAARYAAVARIIDTMLELQEVLLRALGLDESVRHFESMEALQVAGKRARKRLWQGLSVGEVRHT